MVHHRRMPKKSSAGSRSFILRVLCVIGYIAMVAINSLANILPINGRQTGEISDSFGNLFAPAGITFSIWGIIYLLIGGYSLFQLGLISSSRKKSIAFILDRIAPFFLLSSLLNISWIFAWHSLYFGIATLLIAGLLISLLRIVMYLKDVSLTSNEHWWIRVPFAVYAGWVTVAVIANVTTYLVSIAWSGFGLSNVAWTVIILLVGAGIGTITTLRLRSIAYGLVLVWAYIGIWMKHTSPQAFDRAYPQILITVGVCLVTYLLTLLRLLQTEEKR